MDEEQILCQDIQNSLTKYGLPDKKAAKIAQDATERARRAKHSGPFTRPGVLISDRIAEGNGILITIRLKSLDRHDPHEVLQEYLEKENIRGSWILDEQFGYNNSKIRVWKASRTRVQTQSTSSKSKEKNILRDFDKLSNEEQQKILSRLQK